MWRICSEKFCRADEGSIAFAGSSSLFGTPLFYLAGNFHVRDGWSYKYFWGGGQEEKNTYIRKRDTEFRDTSDDIFSSALSGHTQRILSITLYNRTCKMYCSYWYPMILEFASTRWATFFDDSEDWREMRFNPLFNYRLPCVRHNVISTTRCKWRLFWYKIWGPVKLVTNKYTGNAKWLLKNVRWTSKT